MRNKLVQLQFLVQVVVDQSRDTLHTLPTSKGGSFPHPSGDQLERTSTDFLSGAGYSYNSGHTPALVTSLQSRTHSVHIAHTFERVIQTSVSQFNKYFLNRTFVALWVDEFGESKLLGCKLRDKLT